MFLCPSWPFSTGVGLYTVHWCLLSNNSRITIVLKLVSLVFWTELYFPCYLVNEFFFFLSKTWAFSLICEAMDFINFLLAGYFYYPYYPFSRGSGPCLISAKLWESKFSHFSLLIPNWQWLVSQLVFLLASAETILALMGGIPCHCSLSGSILSISPLAGGYSPSFSLILYVTSLERWKEGPL